MSADRSAAVLAHGVGGSTDLPIPYTYAVIGAAWALTFTFAVVAFAWRRPRFDPDKPGRALPRWVTTATDAAVTRWAAAVAAWVAAVAFFGPQDSTNPLPGVFSVLLWVGLVAVSLALGPVWRAISPVRRCTGCSARRSLVRTYPESWEYWPAVLGLFALVWLELASLDPGSIGAIRIWLLIYLAVTLAGALWCGERWCARADPFEVYSVVSWRLSPLRRNPDGRIAVDNPFDHLPSLPVRTGTVALLAVLLGSTAFDSFSAMPQWLDFVDAHTESVVTATLVRSGGLVVFAGVVAGTFWLAARCTGGVDSHRRRELPGAMAHSLIPIVIGYVFAHYLTYLIERPGGPPRLRGIDRNPAVLTRRRGELPAVDAPAGAGHDQGRLRGGRACRGRRRRARRGTAANAGRSPAERTVNDDAGDGRLHVHRAVSPVRWITVGKWGIG